jgi:lisH domain-containing protein FOPNL
VCVVVALKQTLESRGSLNSVRARIRSEIYSAIDDDNDSLQKPKLSNTNILLNEIIREYLVTTRIMHAN